MSKIDLRNTKQSKQISELKNQLEKSGWKIIKENEREFEGKLKWKLKDKTPNLIYSWAINRNPSYDPIWLDFIGYNDYMTYETHINDCSCCKIRQHEVRLHFTKDKGLRVNKAMLEWKNSLNTFLMDLDQIEKSQ